VEQQFMEEHILTKIPPGPEWEMRFTGNAMSLIAKNQQLELDPEIADLCERFKEWKAIEKEAKEEADSIKEQLLAAMGPAERAVAGPFNLKRSLVAECEMSFTRKAYQNLTVNLTKVKSRK